jgi:putative multiple sugar transport system permease protein
MTTETVSAEPTGVAAATPQSTRRTILYAVLDNLSDYGLVLALIAIMVFFQFTTDGTLFKPVNLANLVQQNSFIIVMALGMLLVIVSGHIDLSVGSVAGFIGALSANMMVIWPLGIFSNPLVASIVCLLVGAAIGAAQGYWIAYHKIPSFIVTLAGMLIFRGLCQAMLGGGASVGPLPPDFKALSSGFLGEFTSAWVLVPPTLNAAGRPLYGTGFSLNVLTLIIGVVGVVAYAVYGLRNRRTREQAGYAVEAFTLFGVKTLIIGLLALFLFFQFASYKGLPLVLLLMALLIALFAFVTNRTTIGRRVYAMGGNSKAAQLSGIKTVHRRRLGDGRRRPGGGRGDRRVHHGRDEQRHVDPRRERRLSAGGQGPGAARRRGLRRLQQEQGLRITSQPSPQ